jgi:hypothetical protein
MGGMIWRRPDIYTDVTKELAQREFDNLEVKLQESFESLKKLDRKKTTSEESETDD